MSVQSVICMNPSPVIRWPSPLNEVAMHARPITTTHRLQTHFRSPCTRYNDHLLLNPDPTFGSVVMLSAVVAGIGFLIRLPNPFEVGAYYVVGCV